MLPYVLALFSFVIAKVIFQRAYGAWSVGTFGMNGLAVVVALGSLVVGDPEEGSLLFGLFLSAETLQDRVGAYVSAQLEMEESRNMMQLGNEKVEIITHRGKEGSASSSKENVGGEQADEDPNDPLLRRAYSGPELKDASALKVGDEFLLRQGMRAPCDGIVSQVKTGRFFSVDEQVLTGESRPQTKKAKDPILAGSLVLEGSAAVVVVKAADDSMAADMRRMAMAASEQKAALQTLIEDFVNELYTPLIFRAVVFVFLAGVCAHVVGVVYMRSVHEDHGAADNSICGLDKHVRNSNALEERVGNGTRTCGQGVR